MHYYTQGNPSNSPYICIDFPKIGKWSRVESNIFTKSLSKVPMTGQDLVETTLDKSGNNRKQPKKKNKSLKRNQTS